MVGMGRPGTSPKPESFTCNWFDKLLPSQSLFWACFISVTLFFPKPTSHRARQHAKHPAPSSPPALSLLQLVPCCFLPATHTHPVTWASVREFACSSAAFSCSTHPAHNRGKEKNPCTCSCSKNRWEIRQLMNVMPAPQTSHH